MQWTSGTGSVCLVYLVSLVCLVHLVGLGKPNKQDKLNKPNNGFIPRADFFSILDRGSYPSGRVERKPVPS
jgi:hypothetical protein